MKLHKGAWLPDQEEHMVEWCDKHGEMVDGKTTYQYKKLQAALGYVKNWRVACDIGAHVGFWSMHLAKRFEELHAFEPMKEMQECWLKNVDGINAELHPYALGSESGMVSLTIPKGSTGGTHISGSGDIAMHPLDSFHLRDVDFIKIDVEGYELDVLKGATETLDRCQPCIIVEQKLHTPGGQKHISGGRPAVDFLLDLGYKLRKEMGGDFILTC